MAMMTMITTMKKSYSSLILLPTIQERYEYLKIDGFVGDETFGSHRYLNQEFYKSNEWQNVRNKAILRDNGCDLGINGYEINHRLQVHHINPITLDDIYNWREDVLLNLENLICVSFSTHNAIHYGSNQNLQTVIVDRKPNDTCPWR